MSAYLTNGHHDGPLPIPGTDRTVTFKASASFGDDLRCDAVAAQMPRGSAERTEAYVLARTAAMIVTWDLEDEAGQLLPVTAESVSKLDKSIGNWLAAEARSRFDGRPQEEERPFEKPSPPPSPPDTAKTLK